MAIIIDNSVNYLENWIWKMNISSELITTTHRYTETLNSLNMTENLIDSILCILSVDKVNRLMLIALKSTQRLTVDARWDKLRKKHFRRCFHKLFLFMFSSVTTIFVWFYSFLPKLNKLNELTYLMFRCLGRYLKYETPLCNDIFLLFQNRINQWFQHNGKQLFFVYFNLYIQKWLIMILPRIWIWP